MPECFQNITVDYEIVLYLDYLPRIDQSGLNYKIVIWIDICASSRLLSCINNVKPTKFGPNITNLVPNQQFQGNQ